MYSKHAASRFLAHSDRPAQTGGERSSLTDRKEKFCTGCCFSLTLLPVDGVSTHSATTILTLRWSRKTGEMVYVYARINEVDMSARHYAKKKTKSILRFTPSPTAVEGRRSDHSNHAAPKVHNQGGHRLCALAIAN